LIDATERRQADSDLTGPSAWRGRILLVENKAIGQRLLAGMLARLGFFVDVAVDGAEAVKAAARTDYQAILLAFHIPILDGCEVKTEIQRLHGASLHAPIIEVTASATRSDLERSLASDMDDQLNGATARSAWGSRRCPQDRPMCLSAGPAGSVVVTGKKSGPGRLPSQGFYQGL
jgi:CheY-like chemotaxis protein